MYGRYSGAQMYINFLSWIKKEQVMESIAIIEWICTDEPWIIKYIPTYLIAEIIVQHWLTNMIFSMR